MSAHNDGGPAFPVECDYTNDIPLGVRTGNRTGWWCGLSMRDYFAAKAMAGWLGTYPEYTGAGRVAAQETAALAYLIADAMLAERAK